MEETQQEYKDAIISELGHIRSSIGTRLPADVTRLAQANVRQRIVVDIEMDFVSAIMKTASVEFRTGKTQSKSPGARDHLETVVKMEHDADRIGNQIRNWS